MGPVTISCWARATWLKSPARAQSHSLVQQSCLREIRADPVHDAKGWRCIRFQGDSQLSSVFAIVSIECDWRLVQNKRSELTHLDRRVQQRGIDRHVDQRLHARKGRRAGLHLDGVAEAAGDNTGCLHAGGINLQVLGDRTGSEPCPRHALLIRDEIAFH